MKTKFLVMWLALLVAQGSLLGQARQGGPPPTPKAQAPIDMTGYWTAVITEDWHQRMLTAVKNDMGSGTFATGFGGRGVGGGNIPYNGAARQVIESWDPAKDEREGNQCKAYGAGGIMRQPTRLRISWQDDYTLKVETDYGQQTRLFNFRRPETQAAPATTRPAAMPAPSAQGNSIAEWTILGGTRPDWPVGGSLKVATTNLTPGYYWKNGMPYSGRATITENFRVQKLLDNTQWIVFSQRVEDPTYLNQPYIVTYHFKKLPNGNDWSPTPCTAK
jgi:hypothetical protein